MRAFTTAPALQQSNCRWLFLALLLLTVIPLSGCILSDPDTAANSQQAPSDEEASEGSATPEPPSPDADPNATVPLEFPTGDPAVPADLGGPGFTGKGWETATPGPLGDPKAKPGGSIVSHANNWFDTLRAYGPASSWQTNQVIISLCYDSLCRSHPETLDPLPCLASHWQVLNDHMTFRFRIDPRAHWSDGKPVVADDVLATFRLIMHPDTIEPGYRAAIEMMNEPKVLSKYMFEITCKQRNWRNFRTISSLAIMPAHHITRVTSKQYLRKYSFRYTATSGPYRVYPGDIKMGEELTLRRRKDYWGNGMEINRGLYNFESIRFIVINDDWLAFNKAMKGELDFYPVYTAKWWKEEVVGLTDSQAPSQVRDGYLVAQKVFTRSPESMQGVAFNFRRPPLDDVRVRKALAHLYDRKKLLDKFAYSEYTPLKSYYPGGDYENPGNEQVEYDPKQAMKLLTEAGYTQRDSDGVLMRNGERLSVTITYRTAGFRKYYMAFQEACRRVGVEVSLDLTDDAQLMKKLEERTFDIASSALGGTMFPEPRSHWQSKMADQKSSDNYSGFKSPEADALIEKYSQSFDLKERTKLLRELDGIVFRAHPYMLDWYIPCQRIIWWKKFGMPSTVFTKYGDWTEAYSLWWYDPEMEKELQAAQRAGKPLLPIPPRIVRPWDPAASSDMTTKN